MIQISKGKSTAYTYITVGSWERDVGCAEKQKRKNTFFFFFPSQNVSYPTTVLQMHWYTYVLRVCDV